MSNILKKPKLSTSSGRNGFDLSFHRSFTSPCGMLLPVAKNFAYAGEKFRLNSSLFIRTQPLQTAAFMRLKAHCEWFFVPITQIFQLWNEFYNQTQDIHSSVFFDESNPSKVINLPLAETSSFISSPSAFGDKVDSASSTVTFGFVDQFRVPYSYNYRRLWDMLGYGSLSRYTNGHQPSSFKVPLLDFLAYHRIFYSHYNNTDWFKNNPNLFNVDKYYSDGNIPTDQTKKILGTIHYRPWRKDFFSNILPAPTFSGSFANALDGSLLTSNFEGVANYEGVRGITIKNTSSSHGGTLYDGAGSTLTMPSSNPTFSVGDLRTAYALDKLLRITAFAGSHYDEQTLAHLGFKMPEGISSEAYFIGAQTTPIQIGEVVSTASTGAVDSETGAELAGSTIGDIAGKGFGVTPNDNDLTFTAPCEGMLMCIFSIEPLPDYASFGCIPQNRYRNTYDFWHPEFDNLGMQPIDKSYYDVRDGIGNIYGWQYRFSELKLSFDIVNESFWDTDKKTWIGYRQMVNQPGGSGTAPALVGDSFFFIPPQYTNTIFLSSFWVNSAKELGWDKEGYRSVDVYKGDNFLIDADFKIFKTSNMSVYSLPNI